MSGPQVKGMAMINFRSWLDGRLGDGWFTRTAKQHDPNWSERLLPGEWYAVSTSYYVYERAYEQLDGYDSLESIMAVVAGEVALNDLNGILRAFLWVASPKMFLRTAPRIWDTYANFAIPTIVANDNGRFEAKVSEIPAEFISWVAAAWKGFLPPALELAGGKNPLATIRDRKQTPGATTWEFIYELRYGLAQPAY